MKIDFVSDVSCPWCAIGLHSLEIALQRLGVKPELHFQPFELNPQMAREGEDIAGHLRRKYGATPEQSASTHEAIRQRGEAVGFRFDGRRDRIYNTFDAHRLLHWAGLEGRQAELKHALFEAYFTEGRNPSDPEVLADLAQHAGLDRARAAEILRGDDYAEEVRRQEKRYLDSGIHSVPAVIVDDQYLIQGGQPPEVFEEALRRIANGTAGSA